MPLIQACPDQKLSLSRSETVQIRVVHCTCGPYMWTIVPYQDFIFNTFKRLYNTLARIISHPLFIINLLFVCLSNVIRKYFLQNFLKRADKRNFKCIYFGLFNSHQQQQVQQICDLRPICPLPCLQARYSDTIQIYLLSVQSSALPPSCSHISASSIYLVKGWRCPASFSCQPVSFLTLSAA